MADQNHRAGIFGQRFDQRLAAFDVEVVGRFVKDQQMRRVYGGKQQRKTCLLPTRQTPDHGFGLIGHQAEPGQTRAQAGLALLGAQALQVLQGRFVDVQLIDLMLGEIADAQFRGPCHPSLCRVKFASQEFGQRRFSFAVATQQRDAVILIDAQRQAAQHGRAAIAHRGAVHVDDGGRQFLWLWKGEDHALGVFGGGDGGEFFQHLDPALRLNGLGCFCAEAVNEGLQMRAAGVLLFRLGGLYGAAFGELTGELVVRA